MQGRRVRTAASPVSRSACSGSLGEPAGSPLRSGMNPFGGGCETAAVGAKGKGSARATGGATRPSQYGSGFGYWVGGSPSDGAKLGGGAPTNGRSMPGSSTKPAMKPRGFASATSARASLPRALSSAVAT